MSSIFLKLKNKKALAGTIVGTLIALGLFFGGGYLLNKVLNNPLVITIGAREIKPGDTPISDLLVDGYSLSSKTDIWLSSGTKEASDFEPYYNSEMTVKSGTLLMGVVLVKNNEPFAFVNIKTDNSSKKLKDCTFNNIILYEPIIKAENCAIDGIPLQDATQEKITEKRGEYEKQTPADFKGQSETKWTKGSYELTVTRDSSLEITQVAARDNRVIVW